MNLICLYIIDGPPMRPHSIIAFLAHTSRSARRYFCAFCNTIYLLTLLLGSRSINRIGCNGLLHVKCPPCCKVKMIMFMEWIKYVIKQCIYIYKLLNHCSYGGKYNNFTCVMVIFVCLFVDACTCTTLMGDVI